MQARTAAFLTCLTLVIFIASPSFALFEEWDPASGVPVRETMDINWEAVHATNGDFETLIAWVEIQGGEDRLMAMLYNASGEPVWMEPLQVATAPLAIRKTHIIPSSDGHWILAWESATTLYEGYIEMVDGYTQKIDDTGDPLWPAEGEGVPIVTGNWQKVGLQIASDGDGGAFAFWQDMRDTPSGIYGQRIDATGSTLWEMDGREVVGGILHGSFDPVSRMVQPDGSGGCVLLWREYTVQPFVITLFAQRFDMEGDPLWDAGELGGVPLHSGTDNIFRPKLLPIGNGNYLAVFGTAGDSYQEFHVYAQKFTNDGVLLWGMNGEMLTPPDEAVQFGDAVMAGAGRIAFNGTFHHNSPHFPALYLQSMLVSGDAPSPLWGPQEEGIIIEGPASWEQPGRIAVHQDGSVNLTWREPQGEEGTHVLRTARIDEFGDFLYGGGTGALVSDEIWRLEAPMNAPLMDNETLFLWSQVHEENVALQQQRLDNSGSIQLPDGGETLTALLFGDAGRPSFTLQDEELFCVWRDNRARFPWPYVQKLSDDGAALWQEQGIRLSTPPGGEDLRELTGEPVIAPDDEGGVYVGWFVPPAATLSNQLLLSRLDGDGQPVWTDETIVVQQPDGLFIGEDDLIMTSVDDGVLLAYTGLDDQDFTSSVILKRFTPSGQEQWDTPVVIADEEVDYRILDVKVLEDGTIGLLTHRFTFSNGYTVELYAISSDGQLLWDEPFAFELEEDWYQTKGQLQSLYDNWFLFVEARYQGQPMALYLGQRIEANGEPLWSQDNETMVQEGNLASWDLAVLPGQNPAIWLTWEDIQDNTRLLSLARYDGDGDQMVYIPDVVTGEYHASNPTLAIQPDQSVYLSWQDYSQEPEHKSQLRFLHLLANGEVAPASPSYPEQGAPLGTEEDQPWFWDWELQPAWESGVIGVWEDLRGTADHFHSGVYAIYINDFTTGVLRPDPSTLPAQWTLHNAYPNPFNNHTIIRFEAPRNSDVRVRIYDLLGREVTTLVDGPVRAGSHQVMWDGLSAKGQAVASGTYFLRLEADGVQHVRKLVLVE